jgi:molybdenum cofactor cytidylyltransferase
MSQTSGKNIVGILLAAGSGSRFDPSGLQNKLLQTTASGDKVVVAAAKTLRSTLPSVLAVVRRGHDQVATELTALGCDVVICNDADQGMGVSLVHALQQRQEADGWIIALGDMPYVLPSTVVALHDALQKGADITVPMHQDRRGNPVGFSNLHLAELLQLQGDRGARGLLQSHPVKTVMVKDAGIHHDIDTPEDLID